MAKYIDRIPIVEQPMARVGTIQGIDEYDVQPNQNNPTGINIDSTHAKYNRPSGVLDILPIRAATFSWFTLTTVAIIEATDTATDHYQQQRTSLELCLWEIKPEKTAPFCSILN